MDDVPIVVKTVLSTAIIDRVGLLRLLISNNGEALTTGKVMSSLRVARKTALRSMTELHVIGLVDMVDDTTGDRYKKHITLKKEFEWLLDKDFKKLREGFEPVDNREFMVTKEKDSTPNPSPNSRSNLPFSIGQISIFWRVFNQLEDTERTEEKLHDGLMSTGKFSQSDAAMIIDTMKSDEFGIEQPDGSDVIRRKVNP